MQYQEIDFYRIILPSLFGVFGILIGSIITAIFNFKLKKKEVQLRLAEKIFDRRISAYEDLLEIIKLLQSTISIDKIDENSNLLTYPGILENKETFEGLLGVFWNKLIRNSHWLNINLLREMNFVQDYLYSLKNILIEKNETLYPKIGLIIKPDFIELADNLEKLVMIFFEKEMYCLDFKSNIEYHKYKIKETNRRLSETQLMKQYDNIKNIDNLR
jgi:hypothetical protein